MAECQASSSVTDLQHHHIETSYPTHIEGSSASTCLTAKCEKHPPNGVTRMSPEVNGFIGYNADSKQKTKEDNDELKCSETLENSDTDCNCNMSSDPSVSHITAKIQSLDMSSETVEEKDIFNGIEYVVYVSEVQMPDIMRLITKDLSEPYSIYTYRYFIHNWPKLCFLVS